MTPQLNAHPDLQSTEWCMRLINSPATETVPWPSRPDVAPADHPCSLFAETLNTPTGVRAGYAMWEQNGGPEGAGQALFLVSMGTGMNYFPNTLHGGVVAALLDEAIGLLIFRKMGWATGVETDTYTAKMEITLKGRVETPGVCLIRSWADEEEARKQGRDWRDMRKLWVKAAIEDSTGRVLTEARYLFIRPKKIGKL